MTTEAAQMKILCIKIKKDTKLGGYGRRDGSERSWSGGEYSQNSLYEILKRPKTLALPK